MDKQWLYDYEYKCQEEDKVFSKHATEVASLMGQSVMVRRYGIAYDEKVASDCE